MMGMELSDVYLSFLPRLFKKIAKTDLGLLSIAEKSNATKIFAKVQISCDFFTFMASHLGIKLGKVHLWGFSTLAELLNFSI